jgi:hypothetical protein
MDSYAVGLSIVVGVVTFLAVWLPGLFWIRKGVEIRLVDGGFVCYPADNLTARDMDRLRTAFRESRL